MQDATRNGASDAQALADISAIEAEFSASPTPVKSLTISDDIDTKEIVNADGSSETTDQSKIRVNEQEFVDQRARAVAIDIVKQYKRKTEELEDARANHRNRNRMYMLLVALLFMFTLPTFITAVIGDPALLRYTAAISIVPDFALTLYALWRKY